jgi:cyclophilin family peptidyl-prolyl cis-trans isomerase
MVSPSGSKLTLPRASGGGPVGSSGQRASKPGAGAGRCGSGGVARMQRLPGGTGGTGKVGCALGVVALFTIGLVTVGLFAVRAAGSSTFGSHAIPHPQSTTSARGNRIEGALTAAETVATKLTMRPWCLALMLLAGCDVSPSSSAPDAGPQPARAPGFDAAPAYDPDWRAPSKAARSAGTPRTTRPSLENALATLPPGEGLEAVITTSMGVLRCALLDEKAPKTVAAFVWLANASHSYDGTSIDRLIPDLLLSGGRPSEPAPWAPADERYDGMRHDRAGLLCDNHRAGGILITAGNAPVLDSDNGPNFTVFGVCTPLDLVKRIAKAPRKRYRPNPSISIRQIRVQRP